MTSHAATWTSERVEQLKSCFNAGLSCSQIAHEIGVTGSMAAILKEQPAGFAPERHIPPPVSHRRPAPASTPYFCSG